MSEQSGQFPHLSDVGQRRREEILRDALSQAARRRVRRHAVKALGASVVVLAVAGLYVLRSGSPVLPVPTPTPTLPPIARAPEPSGPTFARIAFAEIQTDDSIIGRYALSQNEPERAKVMNDDELLNSLHDVGVDAGIARIGSQALVVLNDKFFTPGAQ